ncbi:MAG: hypothetical protein M3O02_00370 [Acidobacteriota bacterium]|nr:hypothetical protein [Acidobacteriota bacterium]
MMMRCAARFALMLSLLAHAADARGQSSTGAQTDATIEHSIFTLLDNPTAVYVSLPEADFMRLGGGFELPDQGRQVTALATGAPGGAFDPRDLQTLNATSLGYKPEWIVERFHRYHLDWDITALKLTSLNPEAKRYPWVVIMNGGAANVYEFFVDLKNRPGWAQYLAQKLNVMIVTIPGNFKYGGWTAPIESAGRQPAYLLDRDLPLAESQVRNAIMTNALVLQGVKLLIMKHTEGDLLMIGHSTSGEISAMANDDAELRSRMRGRYIGWGSGGPARLGGQRIGGLGAALVKSDGAPPRQQQLPRLEELNRRDVASYSHGYSGFLNPLYVAGMSHAAIAQKWLEAEGRRRPMFKQPLQDLEHGGGIAQKVEVEEQIRGLLQRSGNPWAIDEEEIDKDLFAADYARMDGYSRMVWTCGHFDRNHWLPEDPMKAYEVYVANSYRTVNPGASVRLMVWDPPMTHYGHLELPRQLAAAEYSVIRWLVRP